MDRSGLRVVALERGEEHGFAARKELGEAVRDLALRELRQVLGLPSRRRHAPQRPIHLSEDDGVVGAPTRSDRELDPVLQSVTLGPPRIEILRRVPPTEST